MKPSSTILRLSVTMMLLSASGVSVHSQDIHFSQIDVLPILFNPAYSGFFDGTGRFGVTYRNQWSSVSKAFSTVAATAEYSLLKRRYNRDGISLGMILYSDRAGTLNYGTTAGNLILSYYKSLNSSNTSFISVGGEASLGQAGFNTSELDIDDPSDNFASTSTNFISVGLGAAWFYQPNDNLFFKVGVAGRNLNRPDISYIQGDNAYIERKYSLYSRVEYRALPDISFMPLAAVMLQNNYTEALFGADVKWYVSETTGHLLNLSGGIHYRWRDAALIEFVAEYNAFLFALTYDANLSKLTPASHSIGSFEVTVVYRLSPSKRVKRKAMPCPIV